MTAESIRPTLIYKHSSTVSREKISEIVRKQPVWCLPSVQGRQVESRRRSERLHSVQTCGELQTQRRWFFRCRSARQWRRCHHCCRQHWTLHSNKDLSKENWRLSTHADPTSTRRAIFHKQCTSSVTFMLAHLYSTINRTSFWL